MKNREISSLQEPVLSKLLDKIKLSQVKFQDISLVGFTLILVVLVILRFTGESSSSWHLMQILITM